MEAIYDQGRELRVFPGYIEKRGNVYSISCVVGVENSGGNFFKILLGSGTVSITIEATDSAAFLNAVKAALNGIASSAISISSGSSVATPTTTFAPITANDPILGFNDSDAGINGIFDVELTSAGPEKIKVIKEIRGLTGLGLKEAKELTDIVPSIILQNVSIINGESCKQKIEAVGGVVTLKGR